jgi:hypothetical protein
MNKNSQIHFYIETSVLQDLKKQAEIEGITLSRLCREKLRDYSLLSRLQETLNHINEKISKEEKILHLLKLQAKLNLNRK